MPLCSNDNVRSELDRVCASPFFRNSPNLQRFLRFVVEEVLASRGDEIKETRIANEVFRRRVDFDPRLDSIVRVEASMLRRKLTAYYTSEGATSSVRIELPKGRYVPRFVMVEPEVSNTVAASPSQTPVATDNWRWGALAVATLAIVIAMYVLNAGVKHSMDGPSIWSKYFQSGSSTLIVFGTPQFFSLDGLLLRDVNVNSPDDIKSDGPIGALQRAIGGPVDLAPKTPVYYTGIGEAFGVQGVQRYFWEHSKHPEVRLNSEIEAPQVHDFNLVIVASMRFRTLVSGLRLPNDFTRVSSPAGGETIVNSNPKPSESKTYYVWRPEHSDQSVEYATISFWPWQDENHRVLLLSGTSTYATQGAVNFVTDPASLAQLETKLHAGGKPVYFQCLLRVHQEGSHITRVDYVTHHVFPSPLASTTTAYRINSAHRAVSFW